MSRKLRREQNKIGMSLFFAPGLTFAQLLDVKRLVRRIRYLNKLNKSPGVRGSESLGELLIEASTVEDINYAGAKKGKILLSTAWIDKTVL